MASTFTLDDYVITSLSSFSRQLRLTVQHNERKLSLDHHQFPPTNDDNEDKRHNLGGPSFNSSDEAGRQRAYTEPASTATMTTL